MRVLSGLGLSVVAAAGLFLFDGPVVGQGVLSLLVLAFVAVVGLPRLYLARTDTDLFVLRAKKTMLFALAATAALLFVRFNTRLATRRAEALIAACEGYREAHSRYPDRLADLAPRFIADIPKARLRQS